MGHGVRRLVMVMGDSDGSDVGLMGGPAIFATFSPNWLPFPAIFTTKFIAKYLFPPPAQDPDPVTPLTPTIKRTMKAMNRTLPNIPMLRLTACEMAH